MKPGEFIALLGPSGCGKTTVLRTLSGLEQVTSGRILIDGEDVADTPVNKRDIGMVFQSYSLFPHMTVLENVEFGLRMRKVDAAARARRSAEALEMVGLGHLGERYAHQLSGGQQQRVALARALVTRPRVLLLDEPLSALDAKVRVQLRDEIRRIQTELGITTLFVTHDQEEALAVADRVAVMNAGNIEQIGTPEELYTSPATRVRRQLRRPEQPRSGDRWPVTRSRSTARSCSCSARAPVDGPVLAMIRPEDFTIAAAEDGRQGHRRNRRDLELPRQPSSHPGAARRRHDRLGAARCERAARAGRRGDAAAQGRARLGSRRKLNLHSALSAISAGLPPGAGSRLNR